MASDPIDEIIIDVRDCSASTDPFAYDKCMNRWLEMLQQYDGHQHAPTIHELFALIKNKLVIDTLNNMLYALVNCVQTQEIYDLIVRVLDAGGDVNYKRGKESLLMCCVYNAYTHGTAKTCELLISRSADVKFMYLSGLALNNIGLT